MNGAAGEVGRVFVFCVDGVADGGVAQIKCDVMPVGCGEMRKGRAPAAAPATQKESVSLPTEGLLCFEGAQKRLMR